jgi:hypothetical protein
MYSFIAQAVDYKQHSLTGVTEMLPSTNRFFVTEVYSGLSLKQFA